MQIKLIRHIAQLSFKHKNPLYYKRSNQIKSNQIKSNQIKSNQINDITSSQFIS